MTARLSALDTRVEILLALAEDVLRLGSSVERRQQVDRALALLADEAFTEAHRRMVAPPGAADVVTAASALAIEGMEAAARVCERAAKRWHDNGEDAIAFAADHCGKLIRAEAKAMERKP